MVNCPSDEFFARACLTHQQDRRIRCRHHFDQLQDLPQSCTLTHDSFKTRLTPDLFLQSSHTGRKITREEPIFSACGGKRKGSSNP